MLQGIKGLVLAFFLTLLAGASYGQATNVYLTNSGTAVGSCPAGTTPAPNLTYTQFNNPSYWGTGTGKIGPGTTVLLCGTVVIPYNTVGLIPQGSGTSSNPIILLFDTNAILESPFFKGGPYDGCSATIQCGGIYLTTNYVIVDGGTNGIVENTEAGTDLMYQDTTNGTMGVFATGTGNKVRNLNINIYQHVSGAMNDDGMDTADMMVDSFSTSVSFCNNVLSSARIGLQASPNDADGGVGGTGTQASCQANTTSITGFNFYLNDLEDHAWDVLLNGGAPSYYYANHITGSHANWLAPSSYGGGYHQDGFITFGYLSNDIPVVTYPYIYNNTFDAIVPVGGTDTAWIFPVSGGNVFGDDLEGTSAVIFNNLFVPNPTGTMAAFTVGGNNEFDITSTSVTSNVMTLNGRGNIATGSYLFFSGLTSATFLNGNSYLIQSCTPCTNGIYSISTSVTINVTHANYSTTADAGKGLEQVGAAKFYYNTFNIANYNQSGTGAGIYTFEGNSFFFSEEGTSQAQQWYYYDDYNIADATSIALMDYNAYGPIIDNAYPTPGTYWALGVSGPLQPLSAWQTWCGCDSHSQVLSTPNLNLNAQYRPTDSTLYFGPNLTSMCTSGPWLALCYDHPPVVGKGGDTIGLPRPATGTWYIGAFQPSTTPLNLSPSICWTCYAYKEDK